MEIYTIIVGTNSTNCYIIKDKNRKSYIIDPGAEGEKILSFIQDKDLDLNGIILTHGHFDHIGAVGFLRDRLSVDVYIHENDNLLLLDSEKNLSCFLSNHIELESAEVLLKDEDIIGNFRVIFTPGHTPGGISLYNKKEGILFSGDLIFNNGYGRTDFSGGDQNLLFTSIRKLLNLPDSTLIYPGHGLTTTIGDFRVYIS